MVSAWNNYTPLLKSEVIEALIWHQDQLFMIFSPHLFYILQFNKNNNEILFREICKNLN